MHALYNSNFKIDLELNNTAPRLRIHIHVQYKLSSQLFYAMFSFKISKTVVLMYIKTEIE